MFRQRSSEGSPVAPDGRDESETSKSRTSVTRSISSNNASAMNIDSTKNEPDVKEKLSNLGNVNLALLTKHLFSKEDLKEDDMPWTWDAIFTEVSSELRSQWEKSKQDGTP
ncbi:uncharacterized protein [Bemisia tabaci]|uniref:uncharacterized protein n=1 Tax=Bemisia tabaci TaxID=7038 RepID=UPI0008F9C326|nr:PREDICTED: intraflagellar transport protein 43 homolog [Bemisia tabaci]